MWENKSLTIPTLLDCFFESEEVNAPFWFETKLEPIFGIDVYASPFPHQLGYKIYRNPPRANLLLIRLENLNQIGSEAVRKFLGLPNFKLINTNIGVQKPYADVYRAVLKAPIPVFYVEKIRFCLFVRLLFDGARCLCG